LNSMTRIHSSVTLLTSRGALVGSRASTPLTFLLSHTLREAWPTCRVQSIARDVSRVTEEWIRVIEFNVKPPLTSQLRIISQELTWREVSVSPALPSFNVRRSLVWYKLAFRRYYIHILIGAVTKLRKVSVSFAMSHCTQFIAPTECTVLIICTW
jgi:hypothetical protein